MEEKSPPLKFVEEKSPLLTFVEEKSPLLTFVEEKSPLSDFCGGEVSSFNFCGGDGEIRTHVPVRANAFRVRPVMTTSIRLHINELVKHLLFKNKCKRIIAPFK